MENASVLRTFWSAVASFIDESADWKCFSLTCKLFSQIAHEWMPAKKNEFRVTIREYMTRHYPESSLGNHMFRDDIDVPLLLPVDNNIALMHVIAKEHIVNTGRIVFKCFTGHCFFLEKNNHFFFWRMVIVQRSNNIIYFWRTRFRYIFGQKCGFCLKIHAFATTQIECVWFERNCLDRQYTFRKREPRSWEIKNDRARRVRQILRIIRGLEPD